MGRVNETISNVNSTLRNLLMMVLIGGAGYGGYTAYELYNEPKKQLADKQAELDKTITTLKQAHQDLEVRDKKIADLDVQLAEQIARADKLEVSMNLLKVRHRLARLKVLEQREIPSLNPVAPSTGTDVGASKTNLMTKIEFVEINDKGDPIGEPKPFDIVGDMVYVDFLHVTFDDKFIEESDLDRGTSLALFQRVFGEHQEPVKGFQLDTVGTRPTAYGRGTEMSDFEKKIWDDFWLIANDPSRAKSMGIVANNGLAPSIRVRPGMTYEIDLRSTGNMTIKPVEPQSPPADAPNGGK